ncbi:MAG: hypothetical protein R2747_00415 [Pyrinomonadaceae bacterium]
MTRVNFISVPFKIESNSGLSQAEGLAKFSSAGIVLEFETKFLGLINTGVKESRLPLEEITEIKFKKGLFKIGTKIEIWMSTFQRLREVPNQNGKIVLKIPRDQHEKAREAVETLQRDLDKYQESLPPPQIPVRSLFGDDESETKELEPDEGRTNPLKTSELETEELDGN